MLNNNYLKQGGTPLRVAASKEERNDSIMSTYQVSQYVDFVEEHFLLVFIHVALSEDLNCSLSACITVYTHPNLAEGTYLA